MEIKIQSIHFDADKKLLDLIRKKIQRLDKLAPGAVGADVSLKLEKQTKIQDKIVEIRLRVPGYDLFVSERAKSFETALTEAVSKLKTQARRRKDKLQAKH